VDNNFALDVFKGIDTSNVSPPRSPTRLCQRCKTLDFWAPTIYIDDNVSELKKSSHSCDFCRMRYQCYKRLGSSELLTVQFDRVGSILRMNRSGPPVLSICGTKGMCN
jgi:hypothetical protein